MKYLYIVFVSLIFIVGCEEDPPIDEPDETFCEFDLPGIYSFMYLTCEDGHCGHANYQNPEDVFSGYFTFGNSSYKTEFEFKCDNWKVSSSGDSINYGFYDSQIDSGTYTYTKELTDHSRYGVWVFDIKFTSISGNTWSSDSHYYCSMEIEGLPELLFWGYQAPDGKTYDFVISPR